MLFYVFGSMFIVHFFPKTPKIGKMVPSSLVSILSCLILEHAVFRNVGAQVVTPAHPLSQRHDWFHLAPSPSPSPSPTDADGGRPGECRGRLACLQGARHQAKRRDMGHHHHHVDLARPRRPHRVGPDTAARRREILEDISDSTGRCTQECLRPGHRQPRLRHVPIDGRRWMIGQSTINVKSGGTGRLSTSFAALHASPSSSPSRMSSSCSLWPRSLVCSSWSSSTPSTGRASASCPASSCASAARATTRPRRRQPRHARCASSATRAGRAGRTRCSSLW